ncbi:MAG: hypothetical protein KGR26_11835 [Cyanobacteria bacterium REEB65]|nr:hypothetical protein [Cyanobacteria bacterium REEB65]
MDQFEVGKTYATRSLADYDCIFSFTILGRTDKTVMIEVYGETVRRRISRYKGGPEYFRPYGSYSLCPVIYAEASAIDLAKQGQ